MPHFVIDYADSLELDVNIQYLIDIVYNVAKDSGLFKPESINVRAIPCKAHNTGGAYKAFIHTNIKLFPGRSPEQKKALTQAVFDHISHALPADVTISIETTDIEIDSYTKRD